MKYVCGMIARTTQFSVSAHVIRSKLNTLLQSFRCVTIRRIAANHRPLQFNALNRLFCNAACYSLRYVVVVEICIFKVISLRLVHVVMVGRG